jgi:hypothetical protein
MFTYKKSPLKNGLFCKSIKIYSNGTIRSATMLIILIRGLIAGPAVSLYGSPTVSPVTEAL